jgi:hypothetical protein
MPRASIRTIACPLALLVSVLASCIHIAAFSETEYQYAITLKVESLALLSKAAEPYASHRAEVTKLRVDLEKAFEYAAGRPNNEASAAQWSVLRDPTKNLLGGFLKRWEDDNTLNKTLIDEKRLQIGKAFDAISALESGKPKPKNP